jgi:hypothetical protein
MTQSYALSQETITKTLNYLATRPWVEVHQLILEITQNINKEIKEIKDGGDATKSGES